jgi:hypothetical protein
VLFVGRAQEKTALFRTEKRRDAHGDSYPWIVKTTGLVNQFYFEQAATVTCPGGHARTMTAKRSVTFGAVCAQCPLQARCTTANDGRSMSIHPHEQLLREARTQVRTPEFQEAYPTRSRVERIVAFTATNHGRRIKLRYLGVDKNHAWLRLRCAAINLRTLINSGLTRADGA